LKSYSWDRFELSDVPLARDANDPDDKSRLDGMVDGATGAHELLVDYDCRLAGSWVGGAELQADDPAGDARAGRQSSRGVERCASAIVSQRLHQRWRCQRR
jgi:hypothetical protein